MHQYFATNLLYVYLDNKRNTFNMKISHISGYSLGNLAIIQRIKKIYYIFEKILKKLGEKNT